jgi:DNA-binding NtrC family response regulator
MIEKVAPTEARVLITGPNGTGKELAHQPWKVNELLIEVNCAAIPSELIERIVCHVKGALPGS